MNKSLVITGAFSVALSFQAFGGQPESHDALCYQGIRHVPSATGKRCAVTVIANASEAITHISIGGGASHKINESDSGPTLFDGHPAIYIRDGNMHCYRRTSGRFKLCDETID